MKIRPYSFARGSVYAYMEKLSAIFNVPFHNDTILNIPPESGSGSIKNIFLEDDFCIRYYNFNLKKEQSVNWFLDKEGEDIYKLFFSCPPSFSFSVDDCEEESFAILQTNNVEATETINANTWVNRVVLIFTREWLEMNFPDAASKIADVAAMQQEKHHALRIKEKMNYSQHNMLSEMIKEMDKEIFPVIHVKTKSLVLLNDFLNQVMASGELRATEQKSLYYDSVVKVEKRLREHLLTSMPVISQLSAEFNLSPSTLQRHFKLVYGKNIYQYYLEEKLAIGRDLIASRKKTISEVAYMLGYNKINSFSRIFRKYFGVLPRDLNSI